MVVMNTVQAGTDLAQETRALIKAGADLNKGIKRLVSEADLANKAATLEAKRVALHKACDETGIRAAFPDGKNPFDPNEWKAIIAKSPQAPNPFATLARVMGRVGESMRPLSTDHYSDQAHQPNDLWN